MKRVRITTHPGEMLLHECLIPLNMSARALARELGIPANRVTEIIAGKRSVTADTALRLSRYFATSAEMWLNLQRNHDLSKALAKNARVYSKIKARKIEEAEAA
jgi:addiction module HigA family antidote